MQPKKLFVSACEPSANLHLRFLAQKLPKDIQICGVFDENVFCDFSHAHASYTLQDFAVMGFFDVFKKLAFFKKAIKNMSELAKECDVALLMDSSSFNIPIAKELKKSRSKTKIVYYILPQVWAWKAWRAKCIEEVCDYLCATLPFEINMYPRALDSSKVRYVGHPLLDELPYLKPAPQALQNGTIAFMPGSRKAEIHNIFPIFLRVARKLDNRKILILPEHFKNFSRQDLFELYGNGIDSFEVSFDASRVLSECSFAFICSGTATLQAALIGTPLVLGYKTRSLDVMIARAFVKLQFIGLANILYNALHCGSPKVGEKRIHAEFIQNDLTPENLLRAYHDTDEKEFFAKVQELRKYLKHGSRDNVARLLVELLEK